MTSAATPLVEVNDLVVRYGPALALSDVSLAVMPGTCMAVLGPNGAGKSTLARAMSGLVPVASGTITFDGKDITKTPPHLVRRAGMVYLPEGRGIFPALTVNENLRMASTLLPRTERKAALDRGFEVFPELTKRRGLRAGMLSGGEQQMLSLSRGLILSPKLVIADEMSLGLAPKLVEMVFESIERLKGTGATILLIEQFVHRALATADHATLLIRGQVAWHGPAASAKEEVLARYLGGSATAAAS
jgi:branched-chain amino acid transport system ATP-binding protein